MSGKSKQAFKGELVAVGPGGAWTRLQIPFDVPTLFGSNGRAFVKGKINGYDFRTSIFPNGDGTFHLLVNKAMQQGAKAKPGDTVQVVVEKDDGNYKVAVPGDLNKVLKEHEDARASFKKMSSAARKEYVDWITSAKQEETRKRRIEKAIPMIAQGKRLKS